MVKLSKLITVLVVASSVVTTATLGVGTVLLLLPPLKTTIVSLEETQSDYATLTSNNASTDPTMPTGDDATLNLLLLNNPKVSAYVRELFSLYQMAAEGKLTQKPFTYLPSVKSLLGLQVNEKGPYPNTDIPSSFIPVVGDKLVYNLIYAGYDAKFMNLSTLNHKMVSSEGQHAYTTGKCVPIAGMFPKSGDAVRDQGPFQANMYSFSISSPSGTAAESVKRQANTAIGSTLTPYEEPNTSARKSDIVYFPDNLVYMMEIYDSVLRKTLGTKLSAMSKEEIEFAGAVLMSLDHNAGSDGMDAQLYDGIGLDAYSSFVSKDKSTRPKVASGPNYEDSVLMYINDISRAVKEFPDSLDPPTSGIPGRVLSLMLMPVLSCENKWQSRWYIDTYTLKYIKGLSGSNSTAVASIFGKLTKNTNATFADACGYLEKNATKTPTPLTAGQPFTGKLETVRGSGKYPGKAIADNWLMVWRDVAGTYTWEGKTGNRIMLMGHVTLKHNLMTAMSGARAYAKLLVYFGVPGVDPRDPATYLNKLGVNTAVVPGVPASLSNATANGGFSPPAGSTPTVSKNGTVSYYKAGAYATTKAGIGHEVGYHDGVPIYLQTKTYKFNQSELYKVKKRNSSTPPVLENVSDRTLSASGCGLYTMTSVIHAVGMGDALNTSPNMKNVINYQNTKLRKLNDPKFPVSSKLQPWALAEHNGLYYNSSKGYPLWFVATGDGGVQAAHNFAPILTFLGVPTVSVGSGYTMAELKTQLGANKPIIIAQNGTKYKWSAYDTVDSAKGTVRLGKVGGKDNTLSGGGHIVGFYGLYNLKDADNSTMDWYVKIMDSGERSKGGSNEQYVKLSNLGNNAAPAWFVQKQIAPSNLGNVNAVPGDGFVPAQAIKSLDILDSDWSPAGANKIVVQLEPNMRFVPAVNDKYTYVADTFTLYRSGVAYVCNNVKTLVGVPTTGTKAVYNAATLAKFDPSVQGAKLTIRTMSLNAQGNISGAVILSPESTDAY